MKRKLLSILLTLCLAFSLLPTAALADGEGTQTNDVAQIGGTGYATLQAAIDAAKSGDTIVLKKSISATEIGEKKQLQFVKADMNVTLDLNQNTITAEAGEAIAINAANITLTVKNGTIENFAGGSYSDGVYAYKESNNLTLKFENIVLKSRTQGLAVQGLTSNSNVNIVNSNITSTEGLGIYYPPKSGTLTISDSEITGVTGIVVKGSNLVVNGEKTIISGTGPNVDPETYYTGATDGSSTLTETGDAVYVESGYNDRDISVSISGGHLNSKNAKAVRMFVKNGENTSAKREISVTGGTFSSDVSAYVAEGYVQNENGTVEQLGETNAVAKIDNTYYKTLADAVAAAQDGDTITLLKDTIGSGIGTYKDPKKDLQGNDQIAAKGFTIDFNQHTYSVDKPAVGSKTYETQGFHLEWKGSVGTTPNITLKNGTLNVAEQHDPNLKLLIQNYCNLTLDNMTVDGTNLTKGWGNYTYVTSNCNGTVKIKDTTIISKDPTLDFAFDVDGDHANRPYGAVSLTIEGNSNISGRFEFNTNKGGNTLSISGGYFTSDPSSYKAADRYVVASDVDGYTYMVTATAPTDDQKITVVDKTNASVDPSITGNDKTAIDSAMSSGKTNVDGVAEAVTPAKKADIVSKSNANPGDNDKVEIEVAVKVVAKTADLAKGQLTFEASPEATVKVNGTAKGTTVPVSNAMLNGKPITVKLPLPTVDGKLFTPKQIKHTSSDGSVEYFLDTQKTGAKTFEIKDDCAVFKITKFSTFELSGKVTYVAPSYSGGSSSDPTYSVSTPSKTEHGTVTVSPKSASKGDTVTVTVKPDSGYVLETLTVTDKNGNELTLKDKGNGKYTFTMPAGKVEVKATFMEDNSMLNFFYDVPNNAYFYEAVKWAVKNGITTGVGNDLFAPEQPCTRAQIVTFLWRAAGSPEPKGAASGMTDVVSGGYYEKAVAWAIENGITTGTTTTTFSPDVTCTRAQAVTFLARALKAKAASAAEFSDVPTGSYFADAVAWAAANGVTEGIGGGLFGSDNDCTRGQIVTFLYRAYNK